MFDEKLNQAPKAAKTNEANEEASKERITILIENYSKLLRNNNDYIKGLQKLYAEFFIKYIKDNCSINEEDKERLLFSIKQLFWALSPDNTLLNPKVFEAFIESNGKSILQGYANFLRDLPKGEIQSQNPQDFRLGENIAYTKGNIIFQNELFQLIYYTPIHEAAKNGADLKEEGPKGKVYSIPLLIIPPWINKYYILDLQENNSLINWLVNNNFSVFIISWVNPGKAYAEITFEDYLLKGLETACQKVLQFTNTSQINLLGYCIGGTLLAVFLGYLAGKVATDNKEKNYINSATFLTTLIDFSQPGEIKMFINEAQIKAIEAQMELSGFFDGNDMRKVFSLLKADDMIWRLFINNYLLGRENKPFDILYWNADSTNLPYRMHQFYLRKFYLENGLIKPNALEFNNIKIDLSRINIDSYFLATLGDHIAPWEGVMKGAQFLGGKKQFTLTTSGHVAGVINPPYSQKYSYITGPLNENKLHSGIKKEVLKAENFPRLKKSLPNSCWPHWLEKLINYLTKTRLKTYKEAYKKIAINNNDDKDAKDDGDGNKIKQSATSPEGKQEDYDWQTNKESVAGSWWPHWLEWLAKHSGEKTPPPIATAQDIIEVAPGSYVRHRIDI